MNGTVSDFIYELNDPELRFVIIHENYHKLYRHLVIYKDLHSINAKVANMACDYVINLKIVKENPDGFAVMPRDGTVK
jgi:predicted metal-dependent peptidase